MMNPRAGCDLEPLAEVGLKLGKVYVQLNLLLDEIDERMSFRIWACCLVMVAAARIGTVLTEELAIEIYKCKLELISPSSSASCFLTADDRKRGKSVPVSAKFGISPKTVRDIWTHRTWAYATFPFWSSDYEEDDMKHKRPCNIPRKGRPGRPKGSRTLQSHKTNRAPNPETWLDTPMYNMKKYLPWCNHSDSTSHAFYSGCCICEQSLHGEIDHPDYVLSSSSSQEILFTDPFHEDWIGWIRP